MLFANISLQKEKGIPSYTLEKDKRTNEQVDRHIFKPLRSHWQFPSGTPTDLYRHTSTAGCLHKFRWLPIFLSLYLRYSREFRRYSPKLFRISPCIRPMIVLSTNCRCSVPIVPVPITFPGDETSFLIHYN